MNVLNDLFADLRFVLEHVGSFWKEHLKGILALSICGILATLLFSVCSALIGRLSLLVSTLFPPAGVALSIGFRIVLPLALAVVAEAIAWAVVLAPKEPSPENVVDLIKRTLPPAGWLVLLSIAFNILLGLVVIIFALPVVLAGAVLFLLEKPLIWLLPLGLAMLLLVCITAVVLYVLLQFVPCFLIVERMDVVDAIERSVSLARQHLVKLLILDIALWLIGFGLAFGVGPFLAVLCLPIAFLLAFISSLFPIALSTLHALFVLLLNLPNILSSPVAALANLAEVFVVLIIEFLVSFAINIFSCSMLFVSWLILAPFQRLSVFFLWKGLGASRSETDEKMRHQ